MFIELTDILRCPAEHEENVLVLLPDGVLDRRVGRHAAGRVAVPGQQRDDA